MSDDLMRCLRSRFGPPAYALLTEVPNATGFAKSRSADAVAMSLWPSRGIELHGFELKVSRSDWQRELADPSKAESICQFCDRWWLVVSDRSIVKDGELPPTWGLLAKNGDGLKIVTPAPQLSPQPITREFLAALLRRVSEQTVTKVDVDAAERKGFERGKAAAKSGTNEQRLEHENAILMKAMKAFEEASGLKINGWDGGRIGDAVKRLMATENATTEAERRLKETRESLTRVLSMIDKQAAS